MMCVVTLRKIIITMLAPKLKEENTSGKQSILYANEEPNLSYHIEKHKSTIYKTLIRPMLMYASQTWILTKDNERLIGSHERGILIHI